MLDFHNHIIPGVDDGASDAGQAREALAAMREQGVRAVIATPHLKGTVTVDPAALAARLGEIDRGWDQLRRLAAEEFPDVQLARGVELMLDAPRPDLADERVRLAGSSFVLVEFAAMTVPSRSTDVLFGLAMEGVRPVVAHPERYSNLSGRVELAGEWRRGGAFLQVNSGSLAGQYGEAAEQLAWELLNRGWVDYLCSDYHGRGRLAIKQCRAAFAEAGGLAQFELLTDANPRRLLADELPAPVPPLTRRGGLLSRLLGRRR